MSAAMNLAAAIIGLGVLLGAVRAIRGGRLADRAVAFELMTSALTCGMLLAAVISGEDRYLDLALVLGLLSFVSTVSVARYMESRKR